MIIFRTSPETIGKVVKHSKHALNNRPAITPGEIILISQTVSKTTDGKPPIRYLMEFERMYKDTEGLSRKIWGKRWDYLLEGRDCKALKKPFDIKNYQISDENYGPGGPVKYVADNDANVLKEKGLLETI